MLPWEALTQTQAETHGGRARGGRSLKTERRSQLLKKKSGGEGGWRPWDLVQQRQRAQEGCGWRKLPQLGLAVCRTR